MVVELDNRGLPPPEPMMRILAALDTLAHGDELHARLDREPVFLYSELDARDVVYDLAHDADGGLTLTMAHR